MRHRLDITDHDRPRWVRARCKLCGVKKTLHTWELKQDMGEAAFSKDICVPPPEVATEEEQGSTCVEDSQRTT